MMKLLAIAIPSYNSQDYLHHAVESLLPGGDEVEILSPEDVRTAYSEKVKKLYRFLSEK